MTARDLPDVATPWTDPLGVTWCVTPTSGDIGSVVLHDLENAHWRSRGPRTTATVNPNLLAGLGKVLPPVPTPKRVARVVIVIDEPDCYFAFAVKNECLYYRRNKTGKWQVATDMCTTRADYAAAHAAFAGAGDLLPGESDDA